MLCRRTRPLPIECVARGYLSGSGWKEYQQTGKVCGITLPSGLRESDRLPEPIFTPATKAETGHDINISEDEAAKIDRPSARRSREAAHARDLQARLRARRIEGHHHRRHEVRVRAGRRRGPGDRRGPDRRSPDARFVAVLAPGSVPAGRRRPQLRQAVRARLPGRDPLEQAAAGAVAARRRSCSRTREKYVEAFRRLSDRELQ